MNWRRVAGDVALAVALLCAQLSVSHVVYGRYGWWSMRKRELFLWVILGVVAGVALALLGGCSIIEPERVNLELQHTSHISQHFGNDRTDYGYNAAGIDLRWQYKRVGVDMFEGAIINSCGSYYGDPYCGGMYGPREVFNARVDVALWRKP